MKSIASSYLILLVLLATPAALAGDVPAGVSLASEERAAREGDRSQAYYHFLLAKGYEFEHLYDDAVRELQLALQFDDRNSFIHGELASLYQRLGREGKALEHGHAAIEADPQNAEARVFLGMLYFKKSRQDEQNQQEMTENAIEQFREALVLDPDREEAYLDLSHIYHVNDRDEEALALLQRYLERSPYSERALFALGNIHWSKEDWSSALEDYLRILEINPDSIRALLDVADTYNNLDEPESALPFYLRALENNPESFNILNQIGTCYEELRELDLAARYYQKALAVKPESLETIDALGNVAFMARRYLEATGYYLQVLDAEPDRLVTRFNLARSYKGLDEASLALVHLERLHRQLGDIFEQGKGTVDLQQFQRLVLEQLANIHVSLEQYDQAAAILEEASLAGEVPDQEVLHNLARVRHMKGDLDAALQVLDRCREYYPDHQEADLLEVEIRLDGGRREGVEDVLDRLQTQAVSQGLTTDLWRRLVMLLSGNGYQQRAIRLLEAITETEEGKTAPSLFFLSQVRLEQDDLTGALASIREAQRRFPADLDFTLLEGEIMLRQDQLEDCRSLIGQRLQGADSKAGDFLRASLLYSRYDQFGLAEEVLSGGLKRFPDDKTLLFQQASTMERLGNAEAAEKGFRRLIEQEPENAQALNYLGYMLAESGQRLDEAIALVGRALRIEPRNGAYLDSMGWALFKAGMTRQAGSYLLDALKLIPEDPTILEHVGDYYLALGQRNAALEHFGKALELGAADPDGLERKMRPAGQTAPGTPGSVDVDIPGEGETGTADNPPGKRAEDGR
jgi:tetratricopeptide (TPR) repeat protein